MTLRRRALLQSAAAASLPMPALAQDRRAATLRFIPSANLSFIDPTISTAGVSAVHGFAVFDCLYGLDSAMQPKPQMAEGHEVSDNGRTWSFRLRPGLKFHDGEPVRAADCIASIGRWSRRDSFGQALANFIDRMEAVDDRNFRIHLKRPMGPLLDAIAHSTVIALFIMPERFASTDPFKQVTEMVGSGPYRFLPGEFVSGSRVAYQRNDAYLPRDEPADWTSGGKRAHFERVEWSIIPDPATAAAALQAGEVDWWEYFNADLTPVLARNPNIRLQEAGRFGLASLLRFNFLNPPFNSKAVRQVVLAAMDQVDTVQAIVGDDPKAYTTCYSMFGCGLPGVAEIDAAKYRAPRDMAALKRALAAAGYNGEKVVILESTDYTFLASGARIAADVLGRLGMNVELQQMDFGTVLQRRNSKEPPEKGGWSIFCTGADVLSLANPAINYYIRGAGGWAGWYMSAEIERLTDEWLSTPDAAGRQALFERIQKISMDDVPMVPLGQWRPRSAFRTSLSGVLPTTTSLFWNVRRA